MVFSPFLEKIYAIVVLIRVIDVNLDTLLIQMSCLEKYQFISQILKFRASLKLQHLNGFSEVTISIENRI